MEHSSIESYEMHVLFKGGVQGVGFRAIARHHARELDLKGTVRNLLDGRVEVYAQGSKHQLEEFLNRMHQEFGEIVEVAVEYFPIEHLHKDFRIIY